MRRTGSRTEEKPLESSRTTSSRPGYTAGDDSGARANPLHLALPVLIPLFVLSLVWLLFGSVMMYASLASMIAYLVGPLGRELVIPAAVLLLMETISAGIPEVIAIALSVASVDVSLAFFVVWNFALLRKSRTIERITDRLGESMRRRLGDGKGKKGYILLAAYVAFPMQFSGGFVATIMGSLLGYDPRKLIAAVTAGSIIGSLTVGLLAYFIGRPILDILSLDVLHLAGILIVVGFIIAAAYLYHSRRRKRDED